MTLRTIGVGLGSAEEARWLLPLACELARGHDAHLLGVHASEPLLPYAADALALTPATDAILLQWQREEARAIREAWEDATRAAGLRAEWRSPEQPPAVAEEILLDGLRAADLVVLGQIDPAAPQPAWRRLQAQVIRQSGRPVLLLPRRGRVAVPARHLLVGWSPTREATRAAHDAVAVAAPGAAVDLVRVHTGPHAPEGLDARQDLAAALDRHGLRVTLIDREARAGEAGPVLLATAAEREADLVATGAFGHSAVYDFVIGAVTSQLLAAATLPVLLSK